jgi:hypothetical protein
LVCRSASVAVGSDGITGGFPVSSAAPFSSPPISATTPVPVSPVVSSLALVLALIGALALVTSISAITWLGLPFTKPRLVTSPTFKPLNSTLEPVDRPETEPLKMT